MLINKPLFVNLTSSFMNYLKYLFAVILVLSSLSLRAQPGDIPG